MSSTLIRGENGLLSYKSGSIHDTIHQTISDTLQKNGIDAAVVCPDGVDPNEWIAVHVIDFYNDVIMLFSVVQYECTSYSCPSMTAGNYEFMWTDHDKYKKATRLCAHTYIEYLMNWIIHLIENETIFPIQQDTPFPDNYMDTVRNILKRLLRVYAHIYSQHFQSLRTYELNDQFEFSVIHFIHFVDHFKLISSYDMRPLADLAIEKVPDLSITKEMILLLKQHEESRLCSASNLSSVSGSSKATLPPSNLMFGGMASESTNEKANVCWNAAPNAGGEACSDSFAQKMDEVVPNSRLSRSASEKSKQKDDESLPRKIVGKTNPVGFVSPIDMAYKLHEETASDTSKNSLSDELEFAYLADINERIVVKEDPEDTEVELTEWTHLLDM